MIFGLSVIYIYFYRRFQKWCMNRIVFFILLWSVFAGCGGNLRTEEQFSRIEQVMAVAPDSSLRILKRLALSDFPTERARAKYSLLLSEALEKNDIHLTDDSVIRIAAAYYADRGSRKERAKTFYYQGRIYENARDFDAAIKAYTRAEEFLEKEDHRLRGLISYSIGCLYAEQMSFQDARNMYSQAAEAFRAEGHETNLGYALRGEGWALSMLHDTKNALAKCNESLEIAKRQNDTVEILLLSQYIAGIHTFSDNNPQAAIEF